MSNIEDTSLGSHIKIDYAKERKAILMQYDSGILNELDAAEQLITNITDAGLANLLPKVDRAKSVKVNLIDPIGMITNEVIRVARDIDTIAKSMKDLDSGTSLGHSVKLQDTERLKNLCLQGGIVFIKNEKRYSTNQTTEYTAMQDENFSLKQELAAQKATISNLEAQLTSLGKDNCNLQDSLARSLRASRVEQLQDINARQPLQEEDAGAHYRFKYTVRLTDADKERGSATINLDPFRIAAIYGITNFAQLTALKKILCAGNRGYKDTIQDIKDIICSLRRWTQMIAEDKANSYKNDSDTDSNFFESDK